MSASGQKQPLKTDQILASEWLVLGYTGHSPLRNSGDSSGGFRPQAVTREHIPVLVCGAGINSGALGKRETFADIGQGLASFFELSPMDYGTSFH